MSRAQFAPNRDRTNPSPSLRQRIRRAFPLADGVTYVYAAGVLAMTWVAGDLLDRLLAVLGSAL